MNTNKGGIVKQSGNDVEGYRSQKVLFQPNARAFLQYSVKCCRQRRQLTLLVQFGMTSFSLNFFSNQIQCSHVFLIIQFPESSNLKIIVLYCRRNARFPVRTSPIRKFSECAACFLIRPGVTKAWFPLHGKYHDHDTKTKRL